MGRIATCFQQLLAANRKALIPYLVAGDPTPPVTVSAMHALVAAGADIIELGVPFSEPEAEGAIIQLAHERALHNHTSLRDTIQMVVDFRRDDRQTPILLMGYANPIEKMGYATFTKAAAMAGVDAVLLVNMPPEEGVLLDESLSAYQLDHIYLLAPTTTAKRARLLGQKSRGFIYYVSLKGTTGAASIDLDAVEQRIKALKPIMPIPIVVGFGIKDGTSAASVATFADGVVVGTAIVKIFADFAHRPEQIIGRVGALISNMRSSMDAVI